MHIVAKENMDKPLALRGTTVPQDSEGRYSLNSIYKLSCANDSKVPYEWLRNKSTIALIKELDLKETHGIGVGGAIKVTNGGNKPGTFGTELVVIAYASYLSPKFHVEVLQHFFDTSPAITNNPVKVIAAPSDPIECLTNLLESHKTLEENNKYLRESNRQYQKKASAITAEIQALRAKPVQDLTLLNKVMTQCDQARGKCDEVREELRLLKVSLNNLLGEGQTTTLSAETVKSDVAGYVIVRDIPWLTTVFAGGNPKLMSSLGNYLTKLSKSSGYEIKRVIDGSSMSNAYDLKVVDKFRENVNSNSKILPNFRK